MSTPDNSLPDPKQVIQDMFDAGLIDYGVIRDGLCDTPEHQKEFDQQQKNKPPLQD